MLSPLDSKWSNLERYGIIKENRMNFDYSEFKEKSREIEQRFGGTRVPVPPFSSKGCKLLVQEQPDLSRFVPNKGMRLLDLGSGVYSPLRSFWEGESAEYYTLDSDDSLDADFCNFKEVPKYLKFDYIYANQVIEHISKEELDNFINDVFHATNKDGLALFTIPNVQYWFKYIGDYDHKNPITFYQLGALLELTGFKVIDVYKYGKRAKEIFDSKDDVKYLVEFLSRYYEMEPYDFVAVLAKK